MKARFNGVYLQKLARNFVVPVRLVSRHACVAKILDGKFWRACKCPKSVSLHFSLTFSRLFSPLACIAIFIPLKGLRFKFRVSSASYVNCVKLDQRHQM